MIRNRNLVYLCSFGDSDKNISLALLAITSILSYGSNFDLLLCTDQKSKIKICNLIGDESNKIIFWIKDYNFQNMIDTTWTRYNIFNWEKVDHYKNLLYLDTDIIVRKNLNFIFEELNKRKKEPDLMFVYHEKEKIEEHNIKENPYHGKDIFEIYDKIDTYKPKNNFTTAVLAFKNSNFIKQIFSSCEEKNKLFLKDYFSLNGKHPHKFNFCDQPMLNYLLNNQNFLDVSFLDDFVENNPHHYEVKNIFLKLKYFYIKRFYFKNNEKNQIKAINHFSGEIGHSNKVEKMKMFIIRNSSLLKIYSSKKFFKKLFE